ncbi:MAG: maleylacetate reductase [Solirubrobacterales bacterium]|nr:maleylacetate reductase [Solirubrobacterales bacterium]
MEFVHDSLGQRVRFGTSGAAAALASEVAERDAKRVMVIAAPAEQELAERITTGLPVALSYQEVVMHVPVEVADRARHAAQGADADLVFSIGGGSTTGLAKAVALTSGLPIIAVPTTYAGSEATPVWGLTEGSTKTTGVDPRVLPKTVVYDAALTLSLPVELSVASGLNAMAHCIDSLWAPRADPINAALATEGIRALAAGLPAVVREPRALAGREQLLYAAYLSATAFASAGSGLHHKICHLLGGRFDLPHAQTHAIVLPYVLALNGAAAPEASARIAGALAAAEALDGLWSLYEALAAPRALADYGLPRTGIPEAARALVELVPPGNPRAVGEVDLLKLLEAAWAGTDPREFRAELNR